ncbi:MAG: CheR family methyltransferase [Bacteroidota bacterium]
MVDNEHIINAYNSKMSNEDFKRLSNYIFNELGIKMPIEKKIMLEGRLQKRLVELKHNNYNTYIDYVFSPEGSATELMNMIDVVTTNKTDFFRESAHFDFLYKEAVPEFVKTFGARQLKVWSAGCSSGEEPYTLTFVLSEAIQNQNLSDFAISATDISTRMLQKAYNGIYPEDRVAVVPLSLKKKYLLRSKDRASKNIRIVPELRKKISFSRLNFMDDYYSINENFDIIFCRNVLIYFEREVQEKVIQKLCSKLKLGGYFFLGHSESISNMKVPLQQIKPTIFKKV